LHTVPEKIERCEIGSNWNSSKGDTEYDKFYESSPRRLILSLFKFEIAESKFSTHPEAVFAERFPMAAWSLMPVVL